MKKSFALIGAAVLTLAVGAVNAQEGPTVLTGAQMDNISAAGGVNFRTNIYRNFRSDQYVSNVHENVTLSAAYIIGNVALADAEADAFGRDTFTQTFTGAQVNQGYSSESYSKSVSATNGSSFYYSYGRRGGRNGNGGY